MLSQGASSLVPTACFLGLCTNGKCDELLCQTTCTATTNYMNFIFMHGHSSLGNGTSQNRLLLWACILLFYVLQRCTLLHTHILLLYILQGCALLHTNVHTHTCAHTHTSPLCLPVLQPLTHTYFSSMFSKAVPSYTHTHTHTLLLLHILQCCTLFYTDTHTSPLYPSRLCPLTHTYIHTHNTDTHKTYICTHNTHIHTSPPLHPPKTSPSYTHTHTHTHTLISAQLLSEINTMG